MVIIRKSISLDSSLLEQAENRYKIFGGKLSTLLNRLLSEWLIKQKVKESCI